MVRKEWGYQAWNRAAASPITLEVVRQATQTVVQRLDANFFRVRFDRLTPGEKRFLRAMAGLGLGPRRSSDIADALAVTVNGLGPVRSKLTKKGMIYSPRQGSDRRFALWTKAPPSLVGHHRDAQRQRQHLPASVLTFDTFPRKLSG
jgi:hypothetical protein